MYVLDYRTIIKLYLISIKVSVDLKVIDTIKIVKNVHNNTCYD